MILGSWNMSLFTGQNFCQDSFQIKGCFSTGMVESVVYAALRPEVSCSGRVWLSGHENQPHAGTLWASVLVLGGLYRRFLACSLILSSHGSELQGALRHLRRWWQRSRLRISLRGCRLRKCFCLVEGRKGCGQMKKCSWSPAASIFHVAFTGHFIPVPSMPSHQRFLLSFFPEPCQVEVRLLLAYNSNSRIPKSPWIEAGEIPSQVETSIEGTIPFSKSVKVYIMPKPARRWVTSSLFLWPWTPFLGMSEPEAWRTSPGNGL